MSFALRKPVPVPILLRRLFIRPGLELRFRHRTLTATVFVKLLSIQLRRNRLRKYNFVIEGSSTSIRDAPNKVRKARVGAEAH